MSSAPADVPAATRVENAGLDVISESDRKGRPSDLFMPWFAANISLLGRSWGAWSLFRVWCGLFVLSLFVFAELFAVFHDVSRPGGLVEFGSSEGAFVLMSASSSSLSFRAASVSAPFSLLFTLLSTCCLEGSMT